MDKVERDQRIRAVMDKMRATAPEGDFYRHAQVKREVGKLIDEAEEAIERDRGSLALLAIADEDFEKVMSERDALKAQLKVLEDHATTDLHLAVQLAEANAKVAVLQELASEVSYLAHKKRQQCACWAKMSGSCPSCAKLARAQNAYSDALANLPAAARTLLDEHARYKEALEEIASFGPASYIEQVLPDIARKALSTPEPSKRRPQGDLEGMCPHENYDTEPCPKCDEEPLKEKPQ